MYEDISCASTVGRSRSSRCTRTTCTRRSWRGVRRAVQGQARRDAPAVFDRSRTDAQPDRLTEAQDRLFGALTAHAEYRAIRTPTLIMAAPRTEPFRRGCSGSSAASCRTTGSSWCRRAGTACTSSSPPSSSATSSGSRRRRRSASTPFGGRVTVVPLEAALEPVLTAGFPRRTEVLKPVL